MRIGVLGGGMMARVHLASLARIAGAEVVRVGAQEVTEGARTLAGQLGAKVGDPEELWAEDGLDALIVATPTDTHWGAVHAAIERGWNVLCEKPFAREPAEAQALAAAGAKGGVKIAVGHVVRYFPPYAGIRDAVANGEIGTPGVARCVRANLPPAGAEGWYRDCERSGGALFDMGIHDVDWLLWTLGPVERVAATVSGGADGNVAMAVLTHACGALSYLEANWCSTAGFHTSVEVTGSGGVLRSSRGMGVNIALERRPVPLAAEASGGAMLAPAPGEAVVPAGPPSRDPYYEELADVLAWFEGGPEPRVSLADAVASVGVVSAALRSATEGRAIEIGGPS